MRQLRTAFAAIGAQGRGGREVGIGFGVGDAKERRVELEGVGLGVGFGRGGVGGVKAGGKGVGRRERRGE